jgi:ABC-type sugar transport system permease subunit
MGGRAFGWLILTGRGRCGRARHQTAPLPRKSLMRLKNPLLPYLFVAPLVILLTFVFGLSLVRLVEFSFKQVRGIDGPWIGLRNYELVLGQPLFWESVRHNLQLFLLIPVMVVIALSLALLLYERLPGWRIHRTILFLPYILAIPIIAVVMKQMFQFSGPVNTVLSALSLDFLILDWIGSTDVALWTVMGLILWRETALGVILFLSRLMSLDETLIEAARLDGATWRQRAWYILIPQMRGTIEFFLVISAITMLSAVFAYVYVIGGGRGGPGTATMVLELYIFNALIRTSLPGVAAAVSVMLFLVSLLLIWALFTVRRRGDD